MLSKRIGSWLLALSDPNGAPEKLPWSRLRGRDLLILPGLALRHGVLPAVVGNLKQLVELRGRRRILAGIRKEKALQSTLGEASRLLEERAALSLLLRAEYKRITEALTHRRIPAVHIRGPEYADRLYPHPSLRPFIDVDLLVPESALNDVSSVLTELGYREVTPPDRKYGSGYGEALWRKAEELGGNVEVHWDLVNSPAVRSAVSVRFEDLQFEPDDPQGRSLKRASASSMLLIAAVHGATSHMFDRLQTLWDIVQLVRGVAGELDEAWLMDVATRTGAGYSLAAALTVTKRILHEPTCGDLLERLQVSPPTRWLRAILSRDVILGLRAPLGSARRQWFRELVKRN